MCGKGTVVKIKKRKIDSSKYVHVDDDSPIPPVLGPFESLASELNIVKEIVARLPQGPGESSSGPRSYVPQSEFDAYLIDQRKQKSSTCKFGEGLYRDKFFTRMWRGVKGLWKVLNANKPLLTFRPNEDGDDVATWSDDGGDKDSEAIKT
ncbi:hypothetical protein KY285_010536 [Solanum tuberosum]|nr:hypothetical protein KY289_011080 [Solanum tuberosum]KAH0734829.1 hypothetical protein KY285_010536 [Solanum tuberosum]